MSPIIQSLANGSARGYGAFVPLGAAGAYESIASATGTGSSATITFSSISSSYQHLQMRGVMRGATAFGLANLTIRVNSDTTDANYAWHDIGGDGSTIYPNGSASGPVLATNSLPGSGETANSMGVVIIDIHDYASTTKYKTIRIFSGCDLNGSGGITLASGLWENTNAITSISLVGPNNFATTTQFALYGIKGA